MGSGSPLVPTEPVSKNLFWKSVDGSGAAEQLTVSEHPDIPSSWSPDGNLLAFSESHPSSGWDIWVVPIEGERKPQAFLQTQFDEAAAVFSPDGRWLAYQSNESGKLEVYVQSFPGPRREVADFDRGWPGAGLGKKWTGNSSTATITE